MSHIIGEADKIDELKDHLYCLIEETIASGDSPEQAFSKATSSMGYPEASRCKSYGRARVVSGICKVLSKIEDHPSLDSPMVIAHAVIWASVMIAMAFVVKDNDTNSSVLMILILAWFASYMALGGSKRSAKQEWVCLKRRIQKKFS